MHCTLTIYVPYEHSLEEFCTAYLDDVIIFSESAEKYSGHLQTVFERLKKD